MKISKGEQTNNHRHRTGKMERTPYRERFGIEQRAPLDGRRRSVASPLVWSPEASRPDRWGFPFLLLSLSCRRFLFSEAMWRSRWMRTRVVAGAAGRWYWVGLLWAELFGPSGYSQQMGGLVCFRIAPLFF